MDILSRAESLEPYIIERRRFSGISYLNGKLLIRSASKDLCYIVIIGDLSIMEEDLNVICRKVRHVDMLVFSAIFVFILRSDFQPCESNALFTSGINRFCGRRNKQFFQRRLPVGHDHVKGCRFALKRNGDGFIAGGIGEIGEIKSLSVGAETRDAFGCKGYLSVILMIRKKRIDLNSVKRLDRQLVSRNVIEITIGADRNGSKDVFYRNGNIFRADSIAFNGALKSTSDVPK